MLAGFRHVLYSPLHKLRAGEINKEQGPQAGRWTRLRHRRGDGGGEGDGGGSNGGEGGLGEGLGGGFGFGDHGGCTGEGGGGEGGGEGGRARVRIFGGV